MFSLKFLFSFIFDGWLKSPGVYEILAFLFTVKTNIISVSWGILFFHLKSVAHGKLSLKIIQASAWFL